MISHKYIIHYSCVVGVAVCFSFISAASWAGESQYVYGVQLPMASDNAIEYRANLSQIHWDNTGRSAEQGHVFVQWEMWLHDQGEVAIRIIDFGKRRIEQRGQADEMDFSVLHKRVDFSHSSWPSGLM